MKLSYRDAQVARNQSKTIRGISILQARLLVLIVNCLYNQPGHRECQHVSHPSICHLLLLTHVSMCVPYRKKTLRVHRCLAKILLSVARSFVSMNFWGTDMGCVDRSITRSIDICDCARCSKSYRVPLSTKATDLWPI